MGRCCTVVGCKSGNKLERKKNRDSNIRQTSFFKIPKDLDKLKKWSLGLCQNLISEKYVCELHFHKDDIIKNDTILLSDGTTFTSRRKVYKLKQDAIPILNNLKDADIAPDSPSACVSEHNELSSTYVSEHNEQSLTCISEHNELSSTYVSEQNEQSLTCISEHNKLSSTYVSEHNEQSSTYVSEHKEQSLTCISENYEQSSACVLKHEHLISGSEKEDSSSENHLADFTNDHLLKILKTTMLPQNWSWTTNIKSTGNIILFFVDPRSLALKFCIKIDGQLNMEITNKKTNKSTSIEFKLSKTDDFWNFLRHMERSNLCDGTGFDSERCAPMCTNMLLDGKYQKYKGISRCQSCRALRRQLQNRESKSKGNLKLKCDKCDQLKHQLILQKKKCFRLQRKNIQRSELIEEQKLKCAAAKIEAIEEEIADLPEIQQRVVRACFDSAKVKNSKQRRYDAEWVYECLLMRIKSSALYDQLRDRQILPLPCKHTLNSYIQKLDSVFGFPRAIFDTLAAKASRMEVLSKRGTLLIDEVALSEEVKLNSRTMELDGFVNLGTFTPERLMNTRADHTLVFMFQPFQGDWVQVVGSFLSKNAVTSDILHKLILECILLLEKAGFQVDCITSDGAQWNRGPWKLFGIADRQFSCEHPFDPTRRLWFMSDFPHLLKCLRNNIIDTPSFWTPDGIVKMLHWQALLKLEAEGKMNLKIGFELSSHHLKPEGFQKMNVLLAMQLFARPLRVAMSMYKDDCYELHDCEATIAFMEKIDNLIIAMSSQTALRPDADCPMRKNIIEFDKYLRDWEKNKKKCNKKKKKSNTEESFDEIEEKNSFPITASTLNGLKLTLGSTLELMEFLHDKCNYDYLLTSRLSKDELEHG